MAKAPSLWKDWRQRYPANAQAVHGECPVELEKWEQTLHGCWPWRRTKGVAPGAVKVARTVLNGGDEETCMVQRALSLPNCLAPASGSG